jgi:hypothetical protein
VARLEKADPFGLSKTDEINLHSGRRDRTVAYDEAMADVEQRIRHGLRKAQEHGRPYVMIIHGHSTSRPGQTTARSVVRGFMRSKEATPFVEKAHSIFKQLKLPQGDGG